MNSKSKIQAVLGLFGLAAALLLPLFPASGWNQSYLRSTLGLLSIILLLTGFGKQLVALVGFTTYYDLRIAAQVTMTGAFWWYFALHSYLFGSYFVPLLLLGFVATATSGFRVYRLLVLRRQYKNCKNQTGL